jgi:hypothetical protein
MRFEWKTLKPSGQIFRANHQTENPFGYNHMPYLTAVKFFCLLRHQFNNRIMAKMVNSALYYPYSWPRRKNKDDQN